MRLGDGQMARVVACQTLIGFWTFIETGLIELFCAGLIT